MIRKSSFPLLGLLLLLQSVNPQSAAGAPALEAPTASRHIYRYHSVPAGHVVEGEEEDIEVEVLSTATAMEYRSVIASAVSRKKVAIVTDEKGRFLSAARTIIDARGRAVTETVRRNGGTAYLERIEGTDRTKKEVRLPTDRVLGVDASLVLLLRLFPFDTGSRWELFMIDFSGHSVDVTAHQAAVEQVRVAAGTFECYRIDVLVRVPILMPRIILWLSKESPHLLVKSLGQRGPFTPTYDTYLTGKE
ncbi:MAG: hypothetical protein A4E73_00071 [Syntrophaceae bacterium PtaU1.Bin231]|nr:MAG: hypothetical protein A4E73_00071 [Syntrophaceae bacterium PtaU1.Bin231]HOG16684.1 hypothetical protein [Syntrophales bacterium]